MWGGLTRPAFFGPNAGQINSHYHPYNFPYINNQSLNYIYGSCTCMDKLLMCG